jgi:predicted Zn-dependent peptidase
MLTNNGDYRLYSLDNGLRVAIDRTSTDKLAGKFTVDFGSIYERSGEEGFLHFLEHSLLIGGTRKYSPLEADEICEKFQGITAETKTDTTSCPVLMYSRYLEAYLDLVSEAFFYPRFEESRVERERDGILNEIAEKKSNPAYNDTRIFFKALLGKDHPLTYFAFGKEDVISKASGEDLRKFHSKGFCANNSNLILSGGVPENVDELIHQYFDDKPQGNVQKIAIPQPRPLTKRQVIHLYEPGLFNIDKPEESAAQINIGILVPPRKSDEWYPTIFLNTILGGHMFSRLMKTARFERNLVYHIESQYHHEFNSGYFQIVTSTPSRKVDATVDAIFSAFKRLQLEAVGDEELERRKEAFKFEIEYDMHQFDRRIGPIERELETGINVNETLRKLNEVTPQKVHEAALKYLPRSRDDENFVLFILDPLKKE